MQPPVTLHGNHAVGDHELERRSRADVENAAMDSFLQYLKSRWPHLGWWHQLSEMWLIVDLSDTLTAVDLRDAAKEAYPNLHLLVIEAKGPGGGAAFGLVQDFKWMAEAWDREGSTLPLWPLINGLDPRTFQTRPD